EVSRQVFEWFSLKDGPQGIAAVARQDWTDLSQVSMEAGAVWVTLDAVQDPGNLGTILRTLDAIGGQGVILLENSADPYDPTAIRASMGAIFNQRLVRTTYAQLALWKKETGIALIGASGAGTEDYHQTIYPPSLALLMGSERQGLKPQHLQLCDHVVRIPMMGTCDSLNLAVATAIVLYEIFNQRRSSAAGGKGEKQ
ncbi:MAG: RNA methyltransferase, partial [Anaerolineaceae bacterium]|nr:RNA methyltransferase [Anaerolineaceae bacterium]